MTIEQFQNKYDSYTHGVLNAKVNDSLNELVTVLSKCLAIMTKCQQKPYNSISKATKLIN